MPRTPILVILVVAVLAIPASASAKVSWLCKPGLTDNPCTPSLSTTVFSPFNKQIAVLDPKAETKPKIDCFYVYPTVSNQNQIVATKEKDPEIRDIALFQTARYSQLCRVFAPVYRQITVPSLGRHDATA